MHKISSRILALLLVLCLLVGNITPALAAEDDGTDVTVSEPQSAPGATEPSTEPEADTTAPSDGTEPDTTPTVAPAENTEPSTVPTEAPAENTEPTTAPTEVPADETEPTEAPTPVPTPVSYPAAPVDEQDVSGKMYVAKQDVTTVYPMFKIEKATAVKVGDTIYATVYVNAAASGAFTYSYLYFGTRTALAAQLDKGGKFDVVAGASGEKQTYHFTLPASAAGTRVPVCILKSDLTARSPYNSSELELIVPSDIPEGKVTPVPTPVSYPAAPVDEQDVSGKMYVAKQDATAVYPMFKIEKATAVKVGDTIYATVYVNAAASGAFTYSYLYFGTRTALAAQLDKGGKFDVVAGASGEKQTYHFTLPASAAGTRVPVCILKSDLTAKSPYNSSELELIVPADIPEGKVTPVPTPVSYPAAPVDEQDVSGKMYVAKQNATTVYPMFKIEKATAVKVGDTIYATVYVNAAASGAFTYSYLYFGTRTALAAQLDKGGKFDVVAGVSGEKQTYHFTLPASAAGTRVPVCILKSDLTARSPYNSSELELIVPADIPEGKVTPVPTPVSYPAAPVDEQDVSGKMYVAKQDVTTVYPMFKIEKATAVKVGDTIYATVYVNAAASGAFTYSYLYFGTRTALIDQLDKGGKFDVVAGVSGEKQTYHFTLPASAAGTRVPVCILKSDLTAKSPYNSSELELIIPSDIPEGTKPTDPTQPTEPGEEPVPAPAIPTLPSDLQEAQIKVLKAEDGVEFKMFSAAKTGMVVLNSRLLIHFETANTSFDRLYLGSKADAFKSPYVQGTARNGGGWVFEFEVPVSYRGTQMPICLGKPDGSWYTSKDLVLSIPADGPADSGTELSDAGIQFLAAGSYVAQSFHVSSSSATLIGGTIYCTITGTMGGSLASKIADKLYLGSRFDQDKSSAVTGSVNGKETTFTFAVSADKQGISIPAVIGMTDGSWDTNQDFFLNIPNFGRSFDMSYYTDGVYDLYGNAYPYLDKADNRGFPVDTDSTLTVSGDTITIKWVSRASDTDKLYFGLVTDDMATREANAISNADYTPIGMNYKVFYITLPKSALGSKIPFVRHSPLWFQDTNGWLEKQDYLVLSDYLPRLRDDTETRIDDAGIHMIAGGSEVEQSFKISASSAALKGDTITVTITGKAAGNNSAKIADKLYLGSRFDQDKSGYVTGAVNADGTTTFVFTVSSDKQGVSIPAVTGFSDGSWDTTQTYFLNIPNFGRTFDLSYYTDGTYDLFGNAYAQLQRSSNRSFPVDSDSKLIVSGDTVTILWVCRSKTYDKLYFGLLSDDASLRDANAVTYEDYTPIGFGYKIYTVTLPKSALGSPIPFLRHSSSGWLEKQDYLVLSDYLPRIGSAPVDPSEPDTPSGTVADGVYNVPAQTGADMFKVVRAILTAKNGKYSLTLTLSGTGYDYLYAGTGAQADTDQGNWAPAKIVNCTINGETRGFYTYTLTVENPGKPIAIASHSKKNDKWYDRSVTLDLSAKKRTATDGSYTVTTRCDADMFKIVSAKLDVLNGEMVATLTLSGRGYDYLYSGTSAQADAADKRTWSPFQTDAEGKYTYTVPVSELDAPLSIAAHSKKNNKWYDRTVTFLSDSLVKIGDVDTPDVPPTPTKPDVPVTPVDPEKPDDESRNEIDTSGSTTVVNNSTPLKDGVYAPDNFSFSGGSGRARIVCTKVTVKNGKAYATIQFVSASGSPTAYAYVKASGSIYYSAGNSVFTIPVELNKNNRILGMTTKMSAAHEIEYTIFVELKDTNAKPGSTTKSDTLSTEAPDIMGLTFVEEIKLEHAEYLKLFRYEDGIVLAEIDLTKDTVLDTDEARKALAEADKAAQAASGKTVAVEEESTDNAQIKADYISELYKQPILRYLLVPEDTELPAGLEKEYLIVPLPSKSLFLMDEVPLDTLEAFDSLGVIKALGVKETENKTLSKALADGDLVYGGTWDKPDYKALIKAEIDLVLTSGKLLPLSEETLKERKQEAGKDREDLTAVEFRDRYYALADRFAVLDVPMLIDRSADEKDALAQADWLRLYGILLGNEDLADKMIEEITAQEEKNA